MKVVERVGQWVAIILLLGYLGYLVALFGRQPPGPARQTAVLGFSAQQVSVYPRFVRGSVWWRVNSGYWHSTPWTQLSPTMPTPLRETLGWMQELHAGTWPGPPVPALWAAWAGHVGAPLGWVVFPEPANGGPAHPLSIVVIVPQKAPYTGYGKFFVLWTDVQGHWQAVVANPVALPDSARSQLGRLWYESTSTARFVAPPEETVVGQPYRH